MPDRMSVWRQFKVVEWMWIWWTCWNFEMLCFFLKVLGPSPWQCYTFRSGYSELLWSRILHNEKCKTQGSDMKKKSQCLGTPPWQCKVVCERVVWKSCVWQSCVGELCVWKSCGWLGGGAAADGGDGRDTEPKTRTLGITQNLNLNCQLVSMEISLPGLRSWAPSQVTVKGDAKDLGLSDHNVRPTGVALGVCGSSFEKQCWKWQHVFFWWERTLWFEGWRNSQRWDGIVDLGWFRR